ncbi:MAG TPA: TlpA disulfide reductase family protein [Candidatus Kapabacteria bacterium]|jgi:thiol-disulfide isomerase/thioredoxin|nr:TlpA disulfide reductase family protein [Candidatus Kapabacteria bacterium]
MKRFISVLTVLAALTLVGGRASAQDLSSLDQLLAKPNGEQTSVATIGKGKVTVVSFWATWCKPCKEEMRAMFPLIQKFQGQVEYIAISIDDTKTMSKVGPFISSKGYTFTVLLDPNRDLFRSLNGTDVPYTLVYNADGTLHSKHDGFLAGDEVRMEKELIALVGGTGAAEPAGEAPSGQAPSGEGAGTSPN